MRKRLGIVIVNWNNKREILKCLKSLKKAGCLNLNNVVVVDNGSTDGSVEKLRTQYLELRTKIRENKENLGYAEGNNRGINYLLKRGIQYILILNPDTVVEKDAINKLLEVMKKDKTIGIVGPKIYDKDKKIWSCGGVIDKWRYSGGLIGLGEKDKGQYDEMREVDYISGTAILVRRKVFEAVGWFEAQYFAYYEDAELCLRAKKKGLKIVFVPDAVIYHKESSSFGKDSPAHSYYMARNHLLYVERNAQIGRAHV